MNRRHARVQYENMQVGNYSSHYFSKGVSPSIFGSREIILGRKIISFTVLWVVDNIKLSTIGVNIALIERERKISLKKKVPDIILTEKVPNR